MGLGPQVKLQQLSNELGQTRLELALRTEVMGAEVARWRAQAENTEAAVVFAKNEVPPSTLNYEVITLPALFFYSKLPT